MKDILLCLLKLLINKTTVKYDNSYYLSISHVFRPKMGIIRFYVKLQKEVNKLRISTVVSQCKISPFPVSFKIVNM
jgi:hypothetical protein